MKKIFIVSAMLMAATPFAFASDTPLSDPGMEGHDVPTYTGPVLSVIPENEEVRVFETSLGSLVMTESDGNNHASPCIIRLSFGRKSVGAIDSFYWGVPGTDKVLSVLAGMNDEEVREAINAAGLTLERPIDESSEED